ncbi:hypothetical protein RCL_jg6614.t1 [Rhizophagus clarus]|uniref:Uncharacterized protein n=1 Tax=Rhizophagus clarus TaxID=94130 RepID=A0A8H3LG09_9GLOM|nr:hypothetical protein RCL_jg6614.t1 [Rhizophagus clarus]
MTFPLCHVCQNIKSCDKRLKKCFVSLRLFYSYRRRTSYSGLPFWCLSTPNYGGTWDSKFEPVLKSCS